MTINGLLARLIFDKNPDREFYIEESSRSSGCIRILARTACQENQSNSRWPSCPTKVVRRDHEYWSITFGRLIGDWLRTTPANRDIRLRLLKKVHLRRDLAD